MGTSACMAVLIEELFEFLKRQGTSIKQKTDKILFKLWENKSMVSTFQKTLYS